MELQSCTDSAKQNIDTIKFVYKQPKSLDTCAVKSLRIEFE